MRGKRRERAPTHVPLECFPFTLGRNVTVCIKLEYTFGEYLFHWQTYRLIIGRRESVAPAYAEGCQEALILLGEVAVGLFELQCFAVGVEVFGYLLPDFGGKYLIIRTLHGRSQLSFPHPCK